MKITYTNFINFWKHVNSSRILIPGLFKAPKPNFSATSDSGELLKSSSGNKNFVAWWQSRLERRLRKSSRLFQGEQLFAFCAP